MVTTKLDFVHIFRTTAGLARQVKWTARFERWKRNSYLRVESAWKERIEQAIASGRHEDVVAIFQEALKIERNEEKKLAIIMKDEEILIFDEKKKDVEDESLAQQLIQLCEEFEKYRNIKGEVGRDIQAKINALNKSLRDFHQHMSVVDGKARTILDQLRADYKNLISAKTARFLKTERGRFSEVVRLAKEQVKQIKRENKDVAITEGELAQLWKDLAVLKEANGKLDTARAERAATSVKLVIDKLFAHQQDLFANMMAEADEYLTILENTIHAYIDIYEDAMQNMPAVIDRLSKEGFPDSDLVVLHSASQEFFGIVQEHVQNVYRFAAYNQSRNL